MNRGAARQVVFRDDQARLDFGHRLAFIHAEFGVETLAYCLMDNHYHLLLRTPAGGLSAAMQHLGSVFTRHLNDRVGRDGPIFRGRFNSILVTTDLYLAWVARYIHRNPVEAGLAERADGYRWSSCRAYLGLRPAPHFLEPGPVLSLFHDVEALAAFTDRPVAPLVDDGPLTSADLLQLVDFAIAIDDIRNGDDDAVRSWLRQTTLVLLAHDALGPSVAAPARELVTFASEPARRMSLSRARRRRRSDPVIDRIIAGLASSLRGLDQAA